LSEPDPNAALGGEETEMLFSNGLKSRVMAKILVVDDKASMRELIVTALERIGYQVCSAANATAALEILRREGADLVISDVKMPGRSGLDLLEETRRILPGCPFILITAFGTIEMAVQAVKGGAAEFLPKPFDLEVLERKVKDLLSMREKSVGPGSMFLDYGPFIGRSPAMQEIYRLIEKIAPTKSAVLIEGESGTGKELAAKALHWRSDRSQGPLVAVSCASLPPTLLESELFGHVRGAFTGAVEDKPGRFERADGGTLFLDEIGDVGPEVQKKLLRVLQEERFERVGGISTVHVDVRIVAATHRRLSELVEQGTFREDLYYRLRVIPLRLPSLRERIEDIPRLAEHFLKLHAEALKREIPGLTQEALEVLKAHSWPGNVRELEHLMLWGITLGEEGQGIDAKILRRGLDAGQDGSIMAPVSSQGNLTEQVEGWEKQLIRKALEKEEGNVSSAAKALGIHRTSLQYKMKKYGL